MTHYHDMCRDAATRLEAHIRKANQRTYLVAIHTLSHEQPGRFEIHDDNTPHPDQPSTIIRPLVGAGASQTGDWRTVPFADFFYHIERSARNAPILPISAT